MLEKTWTRSHDEAAGPADGDLNAGQLCQPGTVPDGGDSIGKLGLGRFPRYLDEHVQRRGVRGHEAGPGRQLYDRIR